MNSIINEYKEKLEYLKEINENNKEIINNKIEYIRNDIDILIESLEIELNKLKIKLIDQLNINENKIFKDLIEPININYYENKLIQFNKIKDKDDKELIKVEIDNMNKLIEKYSNIKQSDYKLIFNIKQEDKLSTYFDSICEIKYR